MSSAPGAQNERNHPESRPRRSGAVKRLADVNRPKSLIDYNAETEAIFS
jgi:hypothetical protein